MPDLIGKIQNIKALITNAQGFQDSELERVSNAFKEIYDARKGDQESVARIEFVFDKMISLLNNPRKPAFGKGIGYEFYDFISGTLKTEFSEVKIEDVDSTETNEIIGYITSRMKSTSQWKSNSQVYEDELILKRENNSDLYNVADYHYKQSLEMIASGYNVEGGANEPIEQLSAKGLAILSHLYSEKDKSERQPLIASSVEDLKHITKLMDNAVPGTNIVVIFQPAGTEPLRFFSPGHKSVLKLERTEEGINLITMDSASMEYSYAVKMLVEETINKNGNESNRDPTKVFSYSQMNSPYARRDRMNRQEDFYQCGIFATKDARQLNRDADFLSKTRTQLIPKTQYSDEYYQYEMPPSYLKSAQSPIFAKNAANAVGDEVVNRKGKTLKQVQEKHQITGYVQHFSKKYRDTVLAYYQENKANPEKIRSDIARFDAGQMTAERLAAIYGPQQPQVELDPLNEPFDEMDVLLNSLGEDNLDLDPSSLRFEDIDLLDLNTDELDAALSALNGDNPDGDDDLDALIADLTGFSSGPESSRGNTPGRRETVFESMPSIDPELNDKIQRKIDDLNPLTIPHFQSIQDHFTRGYKSLLESIQYSPGSKDFEDKLKGMLQGIVKREIVENINNLRKELLGDLLPEDPSLETVRQYANDFAEAFAKKSIEAYTNNAESADTESLNEPEDLSGMLNESPEVGLLIIKTQGEIRRLSGDDGFEFSDLFKKGFQYYDIDYGSIEDLKASIRIEVQELNIESDKKEEIIEEFVKRFQIVVPISDSLKSKAEDLAVKIVFDELVRRGLDSNKAAQNIKTQLIPMILEKAVFGLSHNEKIKVSNHLQKNFEAICDKVSEKELKALNGDSFKQGLRDVYSSQTPLKMFAKKIGRAVGTETSQKHAEHVKNIERVFDILKHTPSDVLLPTEKVNLLNQFLRLVSSELGNDNITRKIGSSSSLKNVVEGKIKELNNGFDPTQFKYESGFNSSKMLLEHIRQKAQTPSEPQRKPGM